MRSYGDLKTMDPFFTNHVERYPWNAKKITPPQAAFFESLNLNIAYMLRDNFYYEARQEVLRNELFSESKLLARFMYLRKYKYRLDKGFKTTEKTIKSIKAIKKLDFGSILHTIQNNVENGAFVPSRQVLQFFLVKCQCYAKLLERVLNCSKYSGDMLKYRLYTGHNWIEVLVCLGMISKIWTISQYLLKNICIKYDELRCALNQLPVDETDKEWEYSEYELPENLANWLGIEEKKCTSINNNANASKKNHSINSVPVRVKRKVILPKRLKKIETIMDLKRFLLKEDKKRRNRIESISKNLNKLQWRIFIRRTKKWIRKMEKLEENERIKLIRKIRGKMSIHLRL